MKNLFLIRHAKSSWDDMSLKDFDRSLNERGHRDAEDMANRLKNKEIVFDKILSSPAKRAQTTARYFHDILEVEATKLELVANIYQAYEGDIIKLIQNTSSSINNLAIFGHNPTFTILANKFGDNYIMNVPTCGIISVNFETELWSNFLNAQRKMLFFDFPKNK